MYRSIDECVHGKGSVGGACEKPGPTKVLVALGRKYFIMVYVMSALF